MYFTSEPVGRPLALALPNSTPACLIRSASHGDPTGKVMRPIFHGGFLPLKLSQGVDRTEYGHGPYRAWICAGNFLKTPSGSLIRLMYETSWPHFCAARADVAARRADADVVARAATTTATMTDTPPKSV